MSYRRTVLLATLAVAGARPALAQRAIDLIAPAPVVRIVPGDPSVEPPAVALTYRAPELDAQLTLEVIDARGRPLISWGGRDGTPLPPAVLDSVVWNLRYPGTPGPDSTGWIPGPLAPPGRYLVTLRAGARVDTASVVVRVNPRATASRTDYGEQLSFQLRVRDRLAQAVSVLRTARTVRAEVAERRALLPDSLRTRFDLIVGVLGPRVTAVESELRRADGTGITDRFTALLAEADHVDGHPTDAQYSTFLQQQIRLDIAVERLRGELSNLLPFVNATLAMAGVEPVPPNPAVASR